MPSFPTVGWLHRVPRRQCRGTWPDCQRLAHSCKWALQALDARGPREAWHLAAFRCGCGCSVRQFLCLPDVHSEATCTVT